MSRVAQYIEGDRVKFSVAQYIASNVMYASVYPIKRLELDKLYVNISITQFSLKAPNDQDLESTKSKQRRREMQEIS
jgi:hypothetical protein